MFLIEVVNFLQGVTLKLRSLARWTQAAPSVVRASSQVTWVGVGVVDR